MGFVKSTNPAPSDKPMIAAAGAEEILNPNKKLLNQFKAIEKMPERDKDVVKTLMDTFTIKGKLKQLVL